MKLLQGKFLVKSARVFLKAKFLNPSEDFRMEWPAWCKEKSGCFVTLLKHPGRDLRGCVGFPEPVFPLNDALLESAFSAAFRDGRFPPLEESELKKTIIEVSVLTKPKKIIVNGAAELIKSVKLGSDGLIVKYQRSFSGLLLPQVPLEWGWNVPEFISQTCAKAGLSPDMWITDLGELSFFKFRSEIFCEKAPEGEVVQL